MTKNSQIRLRFAPSPTGLMHLGNIRTALLNYLYAKQHNGIFILRVEDTDQERNFDTGAKIILEDLKWLSLDFDEGPYFQSNREDIYKEYLDILIKENLVYKCFCTSKELEEKRDLQIALKKPPRYDKTCLGLSKKEIESKLNNNLNFIWRVKVSNNNFNEVSFFDLARKEINFDLKNFSDFPVTRQNGSFTFMFANTIDDITMDISHVLRGEDHLTNTVGQVVIYKHLNKKLPTFWHLPILCNINGKKLSKRDFGFALRDLKSNGFLPEAINNYLAITGVSFKEEILSLSELTNIYDFKNISSASQIKYDLKKLEWVNHKWLNKLSPEEILNLIKNYINKEYSLENINKDKLLNLIKLVKDELVTLSDINKLIKFYFIKPELDNNFLSNINLDIKNLIKNNINNLDNIKKDAKNNNIKFKELFPVLRKLLTGNPSGPNIPDLIEILGLDEAKMRLSRGFN